MKYIVVHRGDVIGKDLSKIDATNLALHSNGFTHKIAHDGNGKHYFWISLAKDQPLLKTQIYSTKRDHIEIASDVLEKVYKCRFSLNMQIYTSEEYEVLYKTVII